MRSIPGAVVVLAGAWLLASTSPEAYPNAYAWGNTGIGLILCAVGVCDGRPRLRFTIRDILWLTVVVAIVVAWCIDHEHESQTGIQPGQVIPVVGQRERPSVE
jgi:hypothetical protein